MLFCHFDVENLLTLISVFLPPQLCHPDLVSYLHLYTSSLPPSLDVAHLTLEEHFYKLCLRTKKHLHALLHSI